MTKYNIIVKHNNDLYYFQQRLMVITSLHYHIRYRWNTNPHNALVFGSAEVASSYAARKFPNKEYIILPQID